MAQFARVPLVNVLDAIPTGLEAAGLHRVAVFGNRAVVDSNIFGAAPKAVRLSPSEVDRVHTTYSAIALGGKRGTQPETDVLESLARELIVNRGAQTIVLAGTDLSSFYADRRPDYPFLDLAELHIDAIVGQATLP